LADSTPVDCDPPTDLLPDHAPDAVQELAFALLHLRVELVPLAMVLGVAANSTMGAGGFTEMLIVCEALPPGPVQIRV
jgi:hypothetical protein